MAVIYSIRSLSRRKGKERRKEGQGRNLREDLGRPQISCQMSATAAGAEISRPLPPPAPPGINPIGPPARGGGILSQNDRAMLNGEGREVAEHVAGLPAQTAMTEKGPRMGPRCGPLDRECRKSADLRDAYVWVVMSDRARQLLLSNGLSILP